MVKTNHHLVQDFKFTAHKEISDLQKTDIAA